MFYRPRSKTYKQIDPDSPVRAHMWVSGGRHWPHVKDKFFVVSFKTFREAAKRIPAMSDRWELRFRHVKWLDTTQ